MSATAGARNAEYSVAGYKCLGDRLRVRGQLAPRQYLQSECGRFRLINHGDGTLKLFQFVPKTTKIWETTASATLHKGGEDKGRFIFRSDGKLQLVSPNGKQYWIPNIIGRVTNEGALVLQRDGNLVAYGNPPFRFGNHFWSTQTSRDMSYYDEKEKLEKQLVEAKALLSGVSAELQSARSAITTLNERVSQLNAELARESKAKADLVNRVDQLSRQILDLNANNADLQASLELSRQLAESNLELSERIKVLDSKLEQQTELLEQLAEKKAKKVATETRVSRLEQRVGQVVDALTQLVGVA